MLKYKKSYLEYKKTYTRGAYMTYGLWLDKFEEVVNKPEEEVKVEDILRYKLWLQVRHAEKSVQYAMTILHNYFMYLKLSDIKCLNPDLIKSPKARANERQAVSSEDYRKILNSIDQFIPKNELRYLQTHLIVRILAETGVRVSELTGLTIDKINLENCGAHIETKKNTDKRWIYWSSQTNELLKKYLPIRLNLKRDSNALFVNNLINGKGITKRSIERTVKMCSERAGLSNIVPHSFRHGKAHIILEKGGTVADVQKILGHRSPISSMKYLQYSDKEHQRRSKLFLEDIKEENIVKPIFTIPMLDNKVALGI